MAKPKGNKKKKSHVIEKPKTRKEQRKEKKLLKKENKRNYFSKPFKAKVNPEPILKGLVPRGLPPPPQNDEDDDEEIPSDFSDEEVDAIMISKKSLKPGEKVTPKKTKKQVQERLDPDEIHRREMAKQKDLEKAAQKKRMKLLKEANEEEDIIISKLEKKLKLNKSKDKKRSVQRMFNDGLDYALEFCLDDEEDEKKKSKKKQTTIQEDDDFGSDFDEGIDDDEENSLGNGPSEEDSQNEDAESGDDSADEAPKVKEDIYGRKRDADGNIIVETPAPATGKYIPPHQRAALASSSSSTNRDEQLAILRKHCKGFLNRLSEVNLHKISNSIEKLYMTHSRHDMNETLYALLSEALLTKSLCKERMIQEHIVLLAYLHASIGTEIGAHFLQMFITKFNEHLCNITSSTDNENKQLNNLVLILAYLYLFKVFEHNLLLELIGKLGDNLCEKTVECLLLIFQSVGFKLRKDDPLAFKNMMNSLQKKIAESSMEMKENLRLKFMVDILNAVKNNNINKIPQFDPELGENLRKKLKAMLTNDKYVITLNITIDDLLRADEVGKWWIVGSAWSGNINDIKAANKPSSTSLPKSERFNEKLLALAKQQKMNTDDRKNIFCIVMSAEDYVDAFEKILHLNLKDQRSIAYVILHCSLNEAKYNPYYAHLAQKFCQHNRKYQLAFQFASWDRINDISRLSKQQIKNLAKFLLHLIKQAGLALSVLKVVNFVDLDKSNFVLMKEIMVGILLAPETDCNQIFEKIAKNAKLNVFKNSIRLFMQHFLLKNEASLKLDEDKMALLKRRIDLVDKLLAYVDL